MIFRRVFSSAKDRIEAIDRSKGKLSLASKSALPQQRPIQNVKKIIAVASGKGGVGKSTTAVNLALALSSFQLKVALLDADIFGPSIPRMMNLSGVRPDLTDKGLFRPLVNYGIECMSMGFFVDESEPVVWRGLMVSKALNQLLFQVDWRSETDFLLIDMPPGTGDVPISICQSVPVSGAIIVSTPQDIALLDVRKGYNMFKKVEVPILGMVQNMSYYHCPKCGEKSRVFGQESTTLGRLIEQETELLGELSLQQSICLKMDHGKPLEIEKNTLSQYQEIARKILAKLPK